MLKKIVKDLYNQNKTSVVICFDLLVSASTFVLSYALRRGDIHAALSTPDLTTKLGFISCTSVVSFYFMGNYRGIWRFSSTPDLLRVIKGVSLAVPLSFSVLFLTNNLENVPRSIFLIQWFLLIVGVGGGRFAYRLYRDNYKRVASLPIDKAVKTLVVGAGYAGQQLIRVIKNDVCNDLNVVGFIDDDPSKRGKIIHGSTVLGSIDEIAHLARKLNATQIIVAIPSASKEQMSRIVAACNNTNLTVRTIPKLGDLISGKLEINKLRKVTPSDLLGRDQVELNIQKMSFMVSDKTVVVTGAGGSIGSELCIQIAKFKPSKLIFFDISEFNIYQLGQKLEKHKTTTEFVYVIGDVKDAGKVEAIFREHRPNVVFHAAAYKHVPLMELSPIEAIKTNVFGTKTVAELANKYLVEKFVLVSTDKAVNPTNVMGTTKRIAEMVCQFIQMNSTTKYEIVRFGNVLGSSGSVIPRFQKQIEEGGPVTVTHPEMLRYFMSIPEAAQLVIQAGAIGNGGEIFVLDMGEPIKIDDLARQMITLAGLKVNEDIHIVYTGLRLGEKLYEELLADGETSIPTVHSRVRVAKVRPVETDLPERLQDLLRDTDAVTIRQKLKAIVPEYNIPGQFLTKVDYHALRERESLATPSFQ